LSSITNYQLLFCVLVQQNLQSAGIFDTLAFWGIVEIDQRLLRLRVELAQARQTFV